MKNPRLFILAGVVCLITFSVPTQSEAAGYCSTYQSPIKQRVSIAKDYSQNHPAIDLYTKRKTPIRAAAKGTVVEVIEPSSNESGQVMIEHAKNLTTSYTNFKNIRVAVGDTVKQGTKLGNSSNQKNHVQFSITKNDNSKDPYCVVNPGKEISLTEYDVKGNKVKNPTYLAVTKDYKKQQRAKKRHRKIWKRFVRLIPQEYRTNLSGYDIFTDGKSGTYAMVYQDNTTIEDWRMAVDMADSFRNYKKQKLDNSELNYTLIHEFAHIFTLSAEQVDYYSSEADCTTHYTLEGCTREGSYFNDFFQDYWSGIYDEWTAIEEIIDDDEYYAALDEFYFKYADHFVTDYASTNPGEDIAEVFTAFVQQEQPTDLSTIANQKINSLYNYPELITLRSKIRAGLNGESVTTVSFTPDRRRHSRR